jgi:UDP:flavonoid glycosyltransferase YjiC (YdhE family)
LGRARILFVSSNGTGLGHLTRSMAIAKRLDPGLEPLFVTFSAAAPVVRGLGFAVEYIASYDRPGAGNDWRWTRRVRARLESLVAEASPAVVVFDGTHPYERLLPALRSAGASLVWCRRAMWRPDSDTAPLWRSHLFDAVLEPGELAAEADAGPTASRRTEARVVDPIVLLDRDELLPRADAERELSLAAGRMNVIVQLGQGPGVGLASQRCLHHLAGRGDVQVAALSSTLAALDQVPTGIIRLRATYPISRYLGAFDVAVAAAGYNAFHELVHLGVPSLFVPMRRQTDDQAARARYAEQRGIARACAGPEDPALEAQLDELLDPDARAAIAGRLGALRMPNGSQEAADWLRDLAGRPRTPGAGTLAGDHAAPARWLTARRAWIFAASIPRTVARLARQALTRPRVRTVVIALGLAGDDLGAELRATVERLGENPERVLVVTDRLDFEQLLAAGVGFEHVPGRGDRQVELAGVPYEQLLRRRLGLVLAERPRPRRVVAIGEVPDDVIDAVRARKAVVA